MGTTRSQKETSPLAHFIRNSLPHKSFRFCSPMLEIWKSLSENHALETNICIVPSMLRGHRFALPAKPLASQLTANRSSPAQA